MDFRQVIAARRSVRKFSEQEVPHEVLAQVFGTALCAPSSRSYEPDASRAGLLAKRYARYRAVGAFTEQLKTNK